MEIKYHRFISYFEALEAEQLCEVAVVESFPKEKVIFQEGEIPDSLYLVLEGQVAFSKCTENQQYQTVAHANPNDFFGEFGVLDGQPRSARALAYSGTILAKIPRDKLMEILENTKGSVILNLFRYIISHLRFTTDQYVKELVHKNKMVLVGEMVNSIIHDFKSPFTGIQLSSEMIEDLHEDEETQEWCDLIQVQVRRMLNMAEELLEFAKGTSVLHKKPIHIEEILKQFKKLHNIYLQSKDVEFTVDLADVVINADENKIQRVFQNLIGNAIEAFDEKGGRIEVTAKAKDKWVEIKISDNGPGIPEDIQEHLFDPFVTKGKRSGTGLGTAIAKSIVEAHGGEITFKSNKNEGTTFWLYLPQLNDG
ncbi:MAG: ATP-binding protein [Cyanobacteriota bacterium]|nr:ATP-binding protein [Cyanobacteriota bacterium]